MKNNFFIILLMLNILTSAQKPKIQYAPNLSDSLIAWRRHFHQNPELSNREFNTGNFIAAKLRAMGLEVKDHVAKTGVVAILRGAKPGPVIALRADIDALPVFERVNIPYASKVVTEYNGQKVNVMHACGHDTHIAMLLGAAQSLAPLKNELAGTVVFIFQPAEEGPPGNEEGGAPLMIKEGVLDNPKVEAIFGIHINSQTPLGVISYKSGATMASSDWFTIKVKGKGSHGSQPWGGIDPIVVAAQIINGLQTIVSRQEPLTIAPAVITVGIINGGVRSNIIPEDVIMQGTVRTLNSKMQKDIHERMKRTAENIAEASGATAEFSIETKTLVTYNNPELVEKTLPALYKTVGKENVKQTVWTTGAEDFSFFADKIPGFFFFVGGMPAKFTPETAFPHHTPDFELDDSKLDVGTKAFCNIVLDYFEAKAPAK
ncbi:MAG: amidohydrolase [Alphaproteobacteria bacterium]|nr:amidohydrolase [Alphaproteobacteria bacterium]